MVFTGSKCQAILTYHLYVGVANSSQRLRNTAQSNSLGRDVVPACNNLTWIEGCFNYFAFPSWLWAYKCTWWRLFQKCVMGTKL